MRVGKKHRGQARNKQPESRALDAGFLEGDGVTFTLNTTSLDTSATCEMLNEILQPTGIEVVSAETDLSNLDVSVDLGTTGLVRGHATGTMDMTAKGQKWVDLPSRLPSVPIDIDLKLKVPIDIDLALS